MLLIGEQDHKIYPMLLIRGQDHKSCPMLIIGGQDHKEKSYVTNIMKRS